MRHIILCLNCISTTTSCDRGEDFRPGRRCFLARSRGCRRSWNASRQDRPERTYEAQITPARRVGTRSGAGSSSLRAIALHTLHAPRHRCDRPPAIPDKEVSPELRKTLSRGSVSKSVTKRPEQLLSCLWTWVTVLCQDMGDTSVGSGGDTCGLRLSGELR